MADGWRVPTKDEWMALRPLVKVFVSGLTDEGCNLNYMITGPDGAQVKFVAWEDADGKVVGIEEN